MFLTPFYKKIYIKLNYSKKKKKESIPIIKLFKNFWK